MRKNLKINTNHLFLKFLQITGDKYDCSADSFQKKVKKII